MSDTHANYGKHQQVSFERSGMVLPGLGSEPLHVSINCDDGIEVQMIGGHELLCPAMQELAYEWSYRAADGTWGEPPFQQVPLTPGLSVPSPLSAEQAGVLAPGTAHTWLFRVMVSTLYSFFRNDRNVLS